MIANLLKRSSRSADTSDSDQQQPPARYEGCLQGVGNGHALGWCWEPAAPDEPVQVMIAVDGEIVAEGSADIARPDLVDYGDGAHGFMIALPDSLQAPGRHRMLALAGPEQTPIVTAPSFWHEAKSDNGWSDVVFEPGGVLSARVPEPPPSRERRALVAKGWLCDADEMLASGALEQERLDRIVAALAKIADACTALGIAYVPALIPRKRDVLAGAPAGERDWVAKLCAQLRDLDHVELLELLPVLRDTARYGPAYQRTDADWNDRGAFFVARALLKEAHKRVPTLRPPALTDLHLHQVPAYLGTLADAPKLRQHGGEFVPCEIEIETELGVAIDPSALLALRMPVERHLAELGETHLRVYAAPTRHDHARLALVGDSAALALVPWLAERTSRTTFFWTRDLPLAQLELELPPVVLHLLREADLHSGPLPEVSEHITVTGSALSPSRNGTSPHMVEAVGDGAGSGPPAPATAPRASAGEPLEGRTSLPAFAAELLLAAMRSLGSAARAFPANAFAALHRHAWTIVLVGLLTALSWPFTYIQGGAGLDNSWVVGLSLATAHGLAFGRQVVFTYGPLGSSLVPAAVTPGTFFLGEFMGGLIQVALVAVLLVNLKRRMGVLQASVLTFLAASLIGWLEAEPLTAIAFGLVTLTFTTSPSRAARAFRTLALAGGALAAFALLVKLNDGVAATAIIAVGLLGSDRRARNLGIAATSLLGTLLVLWLVLGEPLGALPSYLRNGYDVIGGYVEAMGHSEEGGGAQWQLIVLVGSAIALSVGSLKAFGTQRMRRGGALVGAVLLAHYFVGREMFVRYDSGHVAFLALLVAIALLVPWTQAQRGAGLAVAALLAVAAFSVLSQPVDEIVNPIGDAHHLLSQAHEVLDPGSLIAEGQADVRRDNALPSSMAQALRGHCVNTEPDEIAAVWAHPKWRWCPLPVFQSYTAYTPRLDRLNAAAYADAHSGPDRVLRQVDQAIDERNPIWESPLAMLSLLCHFTELEHSGEWQTLARVPDRCGTPHTVAVIHSSLGQTITLPSPPEKAVLVASIDGIQVAGWERLETLFTRAKARYVTVNGMSDLTFRVPPGTADDGLVIAVPSYADYAAPFNLNMDPRTLRVTVDGHSSGSITVRLSAVPIE